MVTCGIIGTGNMGKAVAVSVSKTVEGKELYLANRTKTKAIRLAEELKCCVSNNKEIARSCRYIFIGVKPQMLRDVFDEIGDELRNRKDRFILVTMAAGWLIEDYKKYLGFDVPMIRIMPNTPSMIGQGLVMVTFDQSITADEKEEVMKMLSGAGRTDEVSEAIMACGGTVAGCGPALAAMFIEALADGGVACGLPRVKAYEYAAQMLKGTADLYLETGKATSVLKDEVCSPGGSTIQAVRVLEERAFRGAVMDAIIAANDKGKTLGK